MSLFTENISNWSDWGNVFQSIPAFRPMVERIFMNEHLPLSSIENLTPGTNAVFKVGSYVIKIFAPAESGMNLQLDLETELFAMRWANSRGIAAPRLIADGFLEDKYRFAYMITEYIEGIEFIDKVKTMSDAEKTAVGEKLRGITDKMNAPCQPFNGIDVIHDKTRYRRWDDRYTDSFRSERRAYIQSRCYGDMVFVHGDLCGDNILVTTQGQLYIIDFADAVLAPTVYEHALVAIGLFDLDPALLRGYFGDYTAEELTDICVDGLLIHDFGGDLIADNIGNPCELQCLADLRERLRDKIK